MNELNTKLNTEDPMVSLIGSETFLNLDSDLQNKIIDTMTQSKAQSGGTMGKFLGTKTANVSMHIALILCGLLIALLGLDFVHAYCTGQAINMDLVNTIVPVVTLSLGYIFGKGSSEV